MRISPDIEPCVRKEALKLAFDLKANMKENTENSLAVLGFLLLLSIYKLLDSFDEEEVLELFAFVALCTKLLWSCLEAWVLQTEFLILLSILSTGSKLLQLLDSVVRITWMMRIN